MTALSCHPCNGLTWPARLLASGCECLRPCGSESCTGSIDLGVSVPRPAVVPTRVANPGRVRLGRPPSRDLPPVDDRVRLTEAASMARMSMGDLKQLSDNGLAPKRHGHLKLYDRAELEAWIAGWST